MSQRDVVAIIDDDEVVRQAIDGLLRSAGLDVAAFASAEEFLGARHLQASRCLILDLRMPGMGGLELQQRLADDGPPIPIIIVTAHGDEAARARWGRAPSRSCRSRSMEKLCSTR